MRRYSEPTEPAIGRIEASLKELAAGGWLAVLRGDLYDPASTPELEMARRLGEPDAPWEAAVGRFLALRAAALRDGTT